MKVFDQFLLLPSRKLESHQESAKDPKTYHYTIKVVDIQEALSNPSDKPKFVSHKEIEIFEESEQERDKKFLNMLISNIPPNSQIYEKSMQEEHKCLFQVTINNNCNLYKLDRN